MSNDFVDNQQQPHQVVNNDDNHDVSTNTQPLHWKESLQSRLHGRQSECHQISAYLSRYYHSHSKATAASSFVNINHHAKTFTVLPQILWISGEVGVGKTRLVHDATRQWMDQHPGCLFLGGSFGPTKNSNRLQPYSGFMQAMADLAHQLAHNKPLQTRINDAIHQTLSLSQVSFLLKVIPSLKGCVELRKTNHVPEASYQERFGTILRLFLSAVSSVHQQLVFFLDDLHLAHYSSLDLMAHMVAENPIPGLAMIVTSSSLSTSDQEEGHITSRLLVDKLNVMQRVWKAELFQINLEPLTQSGLQEVIRGIFGTSNDVDDDDTSSWATILHDMTKGNFLHLVWALQWLEDGEYLSFIPERNSWSIQDTFSLGMEDAKSSLADILRELIGRYWDGHSRRILQLAACLESSFDVALLQRLLNTKDHISTFHHSAVKHGFLVQLEEDQSFQFAHSSIQDILLQDMSKEDKARLHLQAARGLWELVDHDKVQEKMFLILNHYFQTDSTVHHPSQKERWAIASLCLHAGKHAAEISSFSESSLAFDMGVGYLREEDWRNNYDLARVLHSHAAEARVSSGSTKDIECLVNPVHQHAHSPEEKVDVSCTLISAFGVSARHRDAIRVGFDMLRELGYNVSESISQVKVFLLVKKLQRRLSRISDGQILRMPSLEDQRQLSALQVIHRLVVNFIAHGQQHLMAFVAILSVEITLQSGLSVFAAGAFCTFGMVCTLTRDFDRAMRFGELAEKLLERFRRIEFLPRVNMIFYGIIYPWQKPLRNSLEPLLRGLTVGKMTGDLQFAILNGVKYCSAALESGQPLPKVERYWKQLHTVILAKNDQFSLAITLPHMQRMHHYLGFTEDPLADKGDLLDFNEAFEKAKTDKHAFSLVLIKYARMQLCYVFHDYRTAYKWIVHDKDLIMAPRTMEGVSILFLRAVILIEMARLNVKRLWHLNQVRFIIKKFDRGAKESPHNILARFYLLKGELASLLGKKGEAYRNFVSAISVAKGEENHFFHALASERTALHFLRIKEADNAKPYFLEALASYDEWGAVAKTKRLRQTFVEQYGSSDSDSHTTLTD